MLSDTMKPHLPPKGATASMIAPGTTTAPNRSAERHA